MRDDLRPTMPTEEVVILMGVFGAALWVPVIGAANLVVASPYTVWYFGAYPTMIIAAFAVSRWHPGRPWLISTTMVFSSYAAALFLVPGTGNLLPFELIIMALLSVPPALVHKKGAQVWARPNAGDGQQ